MTTTNNGDPTVTPLREKLPAPMREVRAANDAAEFHRLSLEAAAALVPVSPRQVEGHCGSCSGTEFTLYERCDNCGEEEACERLHGTQAAVSPQQTTAQETKDDHAR